MAAGAGESKEIELSGVALEPLLVQLRQEGELRDKALLRLRWSKTLQEQMSTNLQGEAGVDDAVFFASQQELKPLLEQWLRTWPSFKRVWEQCPEQYRQNLISSGAQLQAIVNSVDTRWSWSSDLRQQGYRERVPFLSIPWRQWKGLIAASKEAFDAFVAIGLEYYWLSSDFRSSGNCDIVWMAVKEGYRWIELDVMGFLKKQSLFTKQSILNCLHTISCEQNDFWKSEGLLLSRSPRVEEWAQPINIPKTVLTVLLRRLESDAPAVTEALRLVSQIPYNRYEPDFPDGIWFVENNLRPLLTPAEKFDEVLQLSHVANHPRRSKAVFLTLLALAVEANWVSSIEQWDGFNVWWSEKSAAQQAYESSRNPNSMDACIISLPTLLDCKAALLVNPILRTAFGEAVWMPIVESFLKHEVPHVNLMVALLNDTSLNSVEWNERLFVWCMQRLENYWRSPYFEPIINHPRFQGLINSKARWLQFIDTYAIGNTDCPLILWAREDVRSWMESAHLAKIVRHYSSEMVESLLTTDADFLALAEQPEAFLQVLVQLKPCKAIRYLREQGWVFKIQDVVQLHWLARHIAQEPKEDVLWLFQQCQPIAQKVIFCDDALALMSYVPLEATAFHEPLLKAAQNNYARAIMLAAEHYLPALLTGMSLTPPTHKLLQRIESYLIGWPVVEQNNIDGTVLADPFFVVARAVKLFALDQQLIEKRALFLMLDKLTQNESIRQERREQIEQILQSGVIPAFIETTRELAVCVSLAPEAAVNA